MGSDLYEVKVAAKKGNSVKLAVQVVHPDACYLPENLSFGLMLLHEGARHGGAIASAIGHTDLLDEAWMSRYAAGFVTKVKVTGVKNAPSQAAMDNHKHAYWKTPKKWMKGTVEVTVTHPVWAEHAKPKQAWSSRAFTPAVRFDKHPPIMPQRPGAERQATLEATPGADDGFMLVPATSWGSNEYQVSHTELVSVPAYGESAYEVAETLQYPELTEERLKQWSGRAVRLGGRNGALLLGDRVHVEVLQPRMRTGAVFSWSSLSKVELLRLKPGGLRGSRHTYAPMLAMSLPHLERREVKGSTLTLLFRVCPGGNAPRVDSKVHALKMLTAPLPARWQGGTPRPKDPPLMHLLAKPFEEAREADEPTLTTVARIAEEGISAFSIQQPKPVALPALDELSPDEVRAFFAKPWPEAQVTIAVKDPAWFEHMKG